MEIRVLKFIKFGFINALLRSRGKSDFINSVDEINVLVSAPNLDGTPYKGG